MKSCEDSRIIVWKILPKKTQQDYCMEDFTEEREALPKE